MTRASLTDLATIRQAGYTVRKERFFTGAGKGSTMEGWTLTDSEGYELMIGGHGHVAPTQWEAVAEGLKRIERGD